MKILLQLGSLVLIGNAIFWPAWLLFRRRSSANTYREIKRPYGALMLKRKRHVK